MTSDACSAAKKHPAPGLSACAGRSDGHGSIVRGSGGAVGHSLFDIPHFVMEQKMMRGIRDRAEQARREQTTAVIREEYQSIQHEELGKPVQTTTLAK